jgi:hypothetical protein
VKLTLSAFPANHGVSLPIGRPFVFILLRIPLPVTPFVSHRCESPRGVGPPLPCFPRALPQIPWFLLHPCTPCIFMQLRALLRNGAPLSPLFSAASALFLSPRGWHPPGGQIPQRLLQPRRQLVGGSVSQEAALLTAASGRPDRKTSQTCQHSATVLKSTRRHYEHP